MTEADIRERARLFGLDDAMTGNVFVLKRDVEVMERADSIGAQIVADLAAKFAEIETADGLDVVELVKDIVNTYVQGA